jgi:3-hydroxybutyryl-CoA dehydrogenase
LVIEAASERLDVKKRCSNSWPKSAPRQRCWSATRRRYRSPPSPRDKHPERVAGLHFFNPAPVMKLVEVVSGLATSAEVVEQLCQRVSDWGKQPVRCRSTPGFIVNRVARRSMPKRGERWRSRSPRRR